MHFLISPIARLQHRGRFTLTFTPLAIVVVLAAWASFGAARAAAACANPVACENQQPGDPPSDWQVAGAGDPTIQGYATSMSVNVGQTESFKINTPSTNYHIDILRLGYYGGRRRAHDRGRTSSRRRRCPRRSRRARRSQPPGYRLRQLVGVGVRWTVPSNAVSGVYIAHLVRDDSKDPGGDSQIPFVVRNDSSHSDIVVATSDATWEAYNDYGGNSLYTCTVACPPGNPLAYKAAYAVSYNRPFDGALQTDGGASYLYYAEYQMIRLLEENGYDVSYVSDSDLDQNASLLLNHKLFISSGHDEYWSGNERANVQAALDAGVNLAFFSGNEMFWKTRWANERGRLQHALPDAHHLQGDALQRRRSTPQDPPTWTGHLGRPALQPAGGRREPANALTGQQFVVNSGTARHHRPLPVQQAADLAQHRGGEADAGQSLTLGPGNGTLGYEWDVDADNGFRPPGEFDLSSTTVSGVQPSRTTAAPQPTTAPRPITSRSTARPSGALVFGAGTVQWSWGLDDINAWSNAGPPSPAEPAGSEHAAGDGQPVRRHGRAADDADSGPGRPPPRPPTPRRRRRRSPRHDERDASGRQPGHDHRHRDRRRRRRRGRRRGLDRRRLDAGIPASITGRRRDERTGPTRGSPTATRRRRSRRARSTTAATSRRRPTAPRST